MQTCLAKSEHPHDGRITRAFRRHRDRLQMVVSGAGLGSGEVEDVVQQAFLVLAGRIGEVPERAERSFLVSTALRLASDRRRSAWHRLVDLGPDEDPICALSPDRPDTTYDRGVAKRRVTLAAWTLPEEERQVLLLVEMEGLSRAEVSFILDIPPGTVASRLARARRLFEQALRTRQEADLWDDLVRPSPDVQRQFGEHLLSMNPWGLHKTSGWFDQRLLQRTKDGNTQHGWYWHWPEFDDSQFALPEVILGWKPWIGGLPTDRRFPRPVRDSRNLIVDYDVEVRATGQHNLAISSWLLRGEGWSLSANTRAIAREVVVWIDSTGSKPPGDFRCTLQLADESYELWCSAPHGPDYKPGGWTLLTLRATTCRHAGALPFGALLWELARLGFVRLDDQLADLELGNEVMGGAGSTFVQRFAAIV